MRIDWATHFKVVGGNGYGYTLSNIHLRKALTDIGVELTESADVAVHLCHPVDFKPKPGKKNVLFTMYESDPLPPVFGETFKKADAIFAPTKFVKRLFKPHKGKKKVYLSRLGFDDSLISYVARDPAPEKFHVLWIGAPNARKGWPVILSAWSHFFKDQHWCDLTMKTSSEDGDGQVVVRDNIVFDSRRYDDPKDIVSLYNQAHIFVLPTYGEGFGLPILEAMATGCPTIATNYGGHLDFFDHSVGWPGDYIFEEVKQTDGSPFMAACMHPPRLGAQILEIVEDYPKALLRAANGAKRVHESWTWRDAATVLCENVKRLGYEKA